MSFTPRTHRRELRELINNMNNLEGNWVRELKGNWPEKGNWTCVLNYNLSSLSSLQFPLSVPFQVVETINQFPQFPFFILPARARGFSPLEGVPMSENESTDITVVFRAEGVGVVTSDGVVFQSWYQPTPHGSHRIGYLYHTLEDARLALIQYAAAEMARGARP